MKWKECTVRVKMIVNMNRRSRYCNTCINLIDVPVPSFTCILLLLLIFLIKITCNFYSKETVCIVDFEGFFEMNS